MGNLAYIQLVALTERPGARIGRVPPSRLSEPERVVARLLDWQCRYDDIRRWGTDDDMLARLLRTRPAHWWRNALVAMSAAGLDVLRRRIVRVTRLLDAPVDLPPAKRSARIDALPDRRRRIAERLAWRLDNWEIHPGLAAYVAANAEAIPGAREIGALARTSLDSPDPCRTESGPAAVHNRTIPPEPADSPVRIAAFANYGAEADVCWEFARGTAPGVLVHCRYESISNDWWRAHTARAESQRLCVRRVWGDDYSADAVYRVDSRELLRELWSRTSENWAAAYACGPWDGDPDALMAIDRFDEEASLRSYARVHGWAYQHSYGGGADEHYARFAARDPALAEAVYRHAADRVRRTPASEQWWLLGLS